MSFKERLMADLKASMKNKDKVRKDVITMVRAAIKQREVDERIELNDEDIIELIAKQVKQKKDALKDFEKGGRQDLVELTQKEIDILMEYLPKQLSEDEIDEIVKAAIEEIGASTMKDMGKVMSYVMPKVKGRADGSLVNKIVRQYLK
ncbi:GatB/YqeY domain-containing protein [Caloranaerobacter azorensis]|uniref:Aspartyl-tRNA amidotransferase n=2 Tax=Caloranaerobacter azorensis TaxID=116090 RepID=A0A096BKR3_9FIRM|nr:GatB/YqeY domain-containing protein [Caloranaerobacter azorensis]KGG81363.1 aspartyl-tRNA amidotransferase [Caloranaerobacter azorensis H53214]QIB26324.1 GatB/YqeY domain-containing protein [Caloranaerobacter azorensis]